MNILISTGEGQRESYAVHQALLLNKVGVKRQELMSSILILPTPIRWPNTNHFASLFVKMIMHGEE